VVFPVVLGFTPVPPFFAIKTSKTFSSRSMNYVYLPDPFVTGGRVRK
jgi:hypothetical protein